MDLLAQLAQGSEAVDQLPGKVPGVGRDETDPFNPFDVVQAFEQLRKGEVIRPLVVRVHVLAEENHLPHARGRELFNLLSDIAARSAYLPAAHVGNDAIAAEVVASLHDGDERPHLPARGPRSHIERRMTAVVGEIEEDSLIKGGKDCLGHPVNRRRTEGKIDKGKPFEEPLFLCLRHAPRDAEDEAPFLLSPPQPPHEAVKLLLGLLPDAARVDEHHARLVYLMGRLEPGRQEKAVDLCHVVLVHLASEILYEIAH